MDAFESMKPNMMRSLKIHLVITDVGFLCYWFVSAFGLLPPDWLYKDHDNPILSAWNWSFAPIDILASVAGLMALGFQRRGRNEWLALALISLCLTFSAGLMALSFWGLRRDFEIGWWLPNLYILIWPLMLIRFVMGGWAASAARAEPRGHGS